MPEPSATSRLIFHLPPDAAPDDTLALLATLARYPHRFATVRELCAAAASEYGAGARHQDATSVAALTGLLTTDNKPTLSEIGRRLVNADPDVRADLIHYLLYTGWDEAEPTIKTPSWSYRAICERLWQRGDAPFSASDLALETMLAREDQFAAIPAYRQHATAFSAKSVRGVIVWLEHLHPPAVRGGQFVRRYSCPLPLMLLSLAWTFRDVIGVPANPDRLQSVELLLRDERRAQLAQLCLLDRTNLDQMLDQMLDRYPDYMGAGTQAGTYGRFIRLHRLPRLADPTFWDYIA